MPKSTQKAKKPMHEVDVHGCIKKAGHSYVTIADHFKISQTTVRNVSRGKQKSHRVATYIAQLINKPIDDIWPDVYDYQPRESFKERCENARAVA